MILGGGEVKRKKKIDEAFRPYPVGIINMTPERIDVVWTCSDFVKHEHRYRWVAKICGRVQLIRYLVKKSLGW